MIKNIVIIDDNQYKSDSIQEYMKEIFPKAHIKKLDAINPGLLYIHNNKSSIIDKPDEWLIISDMMMPRFSHSEIDSRGGVAVLRELQRQKLKCPVILQSSDELKREEYTEYYENLLGTVKESIVVYNLTVYKELLDKYLD